MGYPIVDQSGVRAIFMQLGQGSLASPAPGVPAASSASVPLVITDATTARTAKETDNGNIIRFTNISDITYTIKAYADVPLPVGTILYAQQGSTGQVTFAPVGGGSVTFETADTYSTRGPSSFIAMKHISLNHWAAMGDLEYLVDATAIVGNPSNADAPPTSIAATADDQRLVRRNGVLVWEGEFAIAAGTADALTATISTSDVFAPSDGILVAVRAASANATTTPTLALNGGTARTITKNGNQPLVAGDIKGAGHELLLRYVSAGPRYELLNPSVSGGAFDSLVEGTGIDIDVTDPRNPIISATGGAGLNFDDRVANYASLPGGLGSGDAGFTVWVDDDIQAYVWDGAAWPSQYAGIKLSGWREVASWSKPAGDPNIVSLVAQVAGFDECLVIFNKVTLTGSGWRDVQVSVNGGTSYVGSGYDSIDTNGVVTTETAILAHSTSASAARSGYVQLFCLNKNTPAKPVSTTTRSIPATFITGSALPVTHVRALPTGGFSFNGGTISIMVR